MAWPRWAIALTEAIHRARPQGIKGPTIFRHHAAVAVAQDAVGTAGNPVTGLAVEGGQLVVTFEDGSTSWTCRPVLETGPTRWPGMLRRRLKPR